MISCVMLAAGESQRMGNQNKLLIKVPGGPLVRRTAKEIQKYPFHEVVFVTGYESDLITPELISFDARIVHNPVYKSGLHSSIRLGLGALTEDCLGMGLPRARRRACDGVVFVHADRPRFHIETVQRMAQSFYEFRQDRPRDPCVLYPTYQGRRGHPFLVSREYYLEILAQPDGDYDLDYLLRRHPESAREVEVTDASISEDLNLPEDEALIPIG